MRPKFTIQYYCDKPVPFPNFIPFSYIFQINQGKKFVPFSNQCWGPTDWSVQMVSPCMIVRIFCLSHLPFMCVDLSFVLMFAFNKYLQYFSFYYHNESGIHRKLFKIPSWELNGKFSHYWEKPGTWNSFFGLILGSQRWVLFPKIL